MITNHNQYSPNSEESDDQPLDFSKPRNCVKREPNSRLSTTAPDVQQLSARSPPHETPANCFTTPSPSPPEHNPNSHHTNQVLCQLLTGNLIPTSTGKLVAVDRKNAINPMSIQMPNESAVRFNRHNSQSPPVRPTSPTPPVHAFNERHDSSPISRAGSASPIGLGPLNQVEMHFSQSPNASGVDRFGTSGGLLTTASNTGAFAANDSAKRSLKYSRPFKAYPRDPLSIPMGYYGLQMPLTHEAIATQSLLATASDQAYLQFRQQMLVSRKTNQSEPRRSSGSVSGSQSEPKRSPTSPESVTNSNGNNSNNTQNNGTNHQNIYLSRSVTPPPKEGNHSLGAKVNGSSASMTPISSASQINMNADDSSRFSNGNSSGNSSSGEADVGSLALSGQLSDGQQSMRKRGRPLPEDLKDDAYWERRRKNNEAAKRSRDARRAKEDEIAIRAAFLEQENLKLRCEIAQLKTETTKLRCLLYNS